jgi:hypothetical protein
VILILRSGDSLDEKIFQTVRKRHLRVWAIDAFIDGLDLAAAGFIRVDPKSTGRLWRSPTYSVAL